MRFFLTAPFFGMAAAVLLLASGPPMLLSRWTPTALAFTHLLTAGFMLQVMLGALQQLFPVALGANFRQPERTARWVHAGITLGAACLVGAFLTQLSWLFDGAALLLGLGVARFLGGAVQALCGVDWRTSPTARGFWVALAGLAVTVGLGLALAGSLASGAPTLPLLLLTQLHVSWGFLVWCGVLLGTVALIVVPMFLVTPEFPRPFARYFAMGVLAGTVAWSAGVLAQWELADAIPGTATVMALVAFCGLTLRLLSRSKRGKRETLHRFWQLSLVSTVVASALWMVQVLSPTVAQWHGTPFLLATLVLMGGCGSVMMGMLYKIVPFLVWQHLQNLGRGQVLAPNMKKVIPQARMDRQFHLHTLSCVLLLATCVWPQWFWIPGAAALFMAQAVLLQNLLYARKVFDNHLVVIAEKLSAATAAI